MRASVLSCFFLNFLICGFGGGDLRGIFVDITFLMFPTVGCREPVFSAIFGLISTRGFDGGGMTANARSSLDSSTVTIIFPFFSAARPLRIVSRQAVRLLDSGFSEEILCTVTRSKNRKSEKRQVSVLG